MLRGIEIATDTKMPIFDYFQSTDPYELDEEERTLLVQLLQEAEENGGLEPQLNNLMNNYRVQGLEEERGSAQKLMDALLFAILPVLFVKILSNLLSAATYSNDIFEDIVRFQAIDITDLPNHTDECLINYFATVFIEECGSAIDLVKWEDMFKWGIVVLYLTYSLLVASYMVFAFVFYFMCLVLTTSRRWGELHKLVLNVLRGESGVF